MFTPLMLSPVDPVQVCDFGDTPKSLEEKRSARNRNFLQLAKLAREWKSPTTYPE